MDGRVFSDGHDTAQTVIDNSRILTILLASLRHQDLRAQPDIIQVLYGTVGEGTIEASTSYNSK